MTSDEYTEKLLTELQENFLHKPLTLASKYMMEQTVNKYNNLDEIYNGVNSKIRTLVIKDNNVSLDVVPAHKRVYIG